MSTDNTKAKRCWFIKLVEKAEIYKGNFDRFVVWGFLTIIALFPQKMKKPLKS